MVQAHFDANWTHWIIAVSSFNAVTNDERVYSQVHLGMKLSSGIHGVIDPGL
jgi:hypothetical protein